MKIQEIKINTESINLDQLLKWAAIVNSGGEAKQLIQGGEVFLNGAVETRRAKKIFPNDVIVIRDQVELKVR